LIRTESASVARRFTAGCIFALTVCLSMAARAEVTVESSVDRSEISIGDFIAYRVSIRCPEEVRLLDDPLEADLKPFEIIDASSATEETPQGERITTITYRISVYETGEHAIPPYVVRYSTPDGEEHEVRSEEHAIMVYSVISDPEAAQDIRDLKDPLVLGLPFWKQVGFWLFVILTLAVLCALVVWLRRRRRRPEAPRLVVTAPPRPAHEIAYKALAALREDREGLLRRGEFEPFSVRISAILREYLQNRYGLLALDRTTEEILQELAALRLAVETEKGFQEFFEDCDLVKFARETLEQSDMLYLIDLAWRLVDETRVPEQEGEPPEGKATGQGRPSPGSRTEDSGN